METKDVSDASFDNVIVSCIIVHVNSVEEAISWCIISKSFHSSFNYQKNIDILCKKFEIDVICESFPELIEAWDGDHYTPRSHLHMSPQRLTVMAATGGDMTIVMESIELGIFDLGASGKRNGLVVKWNYDDWTYNKSIVNIVYTGINKIIYASSSNNHIELTNSLIQYSEKNGIDYNTSKVIEGYTQSGNTEEVLKYLNKRNELLDDAFYLYIISIAAKKANLNIILYMLEKELVLLTQVTNTLILSCNPNTYEKIMTIVKYIQIDLYNKMSACTHIDSLKEYIEKELPGITNYPAILSSMLQMTEGCGAKDCSEYLREIGAQIPIHILVLVFINNNESYNHKNLIKEVFLKCPLSKIRDYLEKIAPTKCFITIDQINLLLSLGIEGLNVKNLECDDAKYQDKEKVMRCLGMASRQVEQIMLKVAIYQNDIKTIFLLKDLTRKAISMGMDIAVMKGRRKSIKALYKVSKTLKRKIVLSNYVEANEVDLDILDLLNDLGIKLPKEVSY